MIIYIPWIIGLFIILSIFFHRFFYKQCTHWIIGLFIILSIFFHRFFYKQCTHITNRERITHIQYIPNIGSPFLIKCLCFHSQTQPISRLNLIYVIFILIRRLGWVSMSVSQSFLRKNVYVWAVAILNLTHAIYKLVWQVTIVITRKFYCLLFCICVKHAYKWRWTNRQKSWVWQ